MASPPNSSLNASPATTAAGTVPWLSATWTATKRTSLRGFALLGVSAAASSAALAWMRHKAHQADRTLPEEFVLEIDLERLRVVEKADASPLALLQGGSGNQVPSVRMWGAAGSIWSCSMPSYFPSVLPVD